MATTWQAVQLVSRLIAETTSFAQVEQILTSGLVAADTPPEDKEVYRLALSLLREPGGSDKDQLGEKPNQ